MSWCNLFSHLHSLQPQPTIISGNIHKERKNYPHVCTFHSKFTPRASLVIDLTLLSLCVPCRCDISVCYKPDSSTDWKLRKSQTSAQIQPLNPTFCSLLCLPIVTFSGALPWDWWPLDGLKGNILCTVIYMFWITDTGCRGKVQRKHSFFISTWCLEAAVVMLMCQPQTAVGRNCWKPKVRRYITADLADLWVIVQTYQRTRETE